MSREQILATIRAGLATNRAWLEDAGAAARRAAPPYVLPAAPDLTGQFADELSRLEGKVYRCADDEEALETIGALLTARAADRVIAWELEQIGLPGLAQLLRARGIACLDSQVLNRADRKERLQTLEPARVCITGVDAAIAESGSLAIVHGPGKPRMASLLAPCHIAVVRANQLVRGLGDGLERLGERYPAGFFEQTSNLTLITGPSRTADIEMTLTLGIHGPKELHVVVIDR